MGPAILVVAIVGLAGFAAFCAFGSWIVFSNQAELAVKAIDKQLIPWIEASQLSPSDKQSIVEQLDLLIPKLKSGSIDSNQLTRLRNCLQDNPVLMWGSVQSVEHQAVGAGLSETELSSLQRAHERLLRMAVERELSRQDMDYTLQEISVVRQDGAGLEVGSSLNGDQVRSYMQRVEKILNRSKVPNEPYSKSPAEAFGLLLDAALQTTSKSQN